MGLRELAQRHNRQITTNQTTGFAWPISITDPDGTTVEVSGFGDDISALIDPETGQAISGRLASIAVNINELADKGLGLPVEIHDKKIKPWVVEFDDINGNPHVFKVEKSNPDRALGMVTCLLEFYEK